MVDFANIARGLLSLEINTIQKDGMSGQKMPTAPNALVDLMELYWNYLCERASRLGFSQQPLAGWQQLVSLGFGQGRAPFPPPNPYPTGIEREAKNHLPDFLAAASKVVSLDTLGQLRDVAASLLEMQLRIDTIARGGEQFSTLADQLKPFRSDIARVAERIQEEERSILLRIQRNCDQLKALGPLAGGRTIDRHAPEKGYKPAELVQIRKAWDLGTEVILMQTVIQLDGDVVQRFEPGVDQASRATLHTLHAGAVDLSFRYWTSLIKVVAGFAGSAISGLVRS